MNVSHVIRPKVLVTGASGMIGRRMVAHLLAQGTPVVALDIHSRAEAAPGVEVHECDLLNCDGVRSAVAHLAPTHIIHLAARTDLEGRTLDDYRVNFDGTRNLIDAASRVAAVKGVVFTSTQLVCSVGYRPKDDEDFRPDTLYGESKVLMEKLVRGSSLPFHWCIARPTTVWGPGMSAHYRRFFRMLERGWYFHVGSEPLYKSYGYVGNVVYQYERLLSAPREKIDGRVFYLADYSPIELHSWIERFREALDAPRLSTVPLPVARALAALGDMIGRTPGLSFPFTSFRLRNIVTAYTFDLSRTEEVCGPLPFSVEQGIEETVHWLRSVAGPGRRHRRAESPGARGNVP
jgi:nucleoside-diphosphate-sugar epimerase